MSLHLFEALGSGQTTIVAEAGDPERAGDVGKSG